MYGRHREKKKEYKDSNQERVGLSKLANQWDRIQSLGRNPYIYGQLIFYKGAKAIWCGKDGLF